MTPANSGRIRSALKVNLRVVYDFPLVSQHPRTSGSPFELLTATPELIGALHSAYPKDINQRKHDILVNRITDPGEDVWVIGDDAGDLLGFGCLAWTDHVILRDRHTIKVAADRALFIDDLVVKKHRRRGAHGYAIARRIELAAEAGRRVGRVAIAETNVASRESFAAFGARPVGRIITSRKLGRSIQLERLSPEARHGR